MRFGFKNKAKKYKCKYFDSIFMKFKSQIALNLPNYFKTQKLQELRNCLDS